MPRATRFPNRPLRPRTLALLFSLVACAPDGPPVLSGPVAVRASADANGQSKVAACHRAGAGWNTLSIAAPAWPAHRAHGDYALDWQVDPASPAGDGRTFARITDAVLAVDSTRRANAEQAAGNCRITITVAAGTYRGGWASSSTAPERLPFIITVPDVTVQGATPPLLDAKGRARLDVNGAETILSPDSSAQADLVFVVSTDDAGFRGDGVTLANFRIASTALATQVSPIGAQRVQRLRIAGNRIDGRFNGPVDLHAAEATLEENALRGHQGCGFCLNGPGRYVVAGNRLEDGGFAGVFVAPITIAAGFRLGDNPRTIAIPPDQAYPSPAVSTSVTNNWIGRYQRQSNGLGSGVRVVTFAPAANAEPQGTDVELLGNDLDRNTLGVNVDANVTATVAPPRRASVAVRLSGNAITGSCRAPLLASFARSSRALRVSTTQAYLTASSYGLTADPTLPLASAWIDHPAGFGNALQWNGVTQANGSTVPATLPAATCP